MSDLPSTGTASDDGRGSLTLDDARDSFDTAQREFARKAVDFLFPGALDEPDHEAQSPHVAAASRLPDVTTSEPKTPTAHRRRDTA